VKNNFWYQLTQVGLDKGPTNGLLLLHLHPISFKTVIH